MVVPCSCGSDVLIAPCMLVTQDTYGDERETNLSAVIAAASQWSGAKLVSSGTSGGHSRIPRTDELTHKVAVWV